MAKNWDDLTDRDFARLAACGWKQASCPKRTLETAGGFESACFLHVDLPAPTLRQRVKDLWSDAACGRIFRVKGFLPAEDGWLELNATPDSLTLRPIPQGQEVVIGIGEGREREGIVDHLGAELPA